MNENPSIPQSVQRWQEEVARLREMIADQKDTRQKLIWMLYIGVPLSLPSAYWHPALPLVGVALVVTSWLTGRYFSWGHLMERGYQLKMAKDQLRKERKAAGLPELESI